MFLLESAQGLSKPQGNIFHYVMASNERRPGVLDPFALTMTLSKQLVRPRVSLKLCEAQSWRERVCRDKLKKQERQMMLWDSDDRIVPLTPADQADGSKLGNSSAGKAVKLTRDPDRAAAVHRDGATADNSAGSHHPSCRARREQPHSIIFIRCWTTSFSTNAFCKLKRDKAPGVDGVSVDSIRRTFE